MDDPIVAVGVLALLLTAAWMPLAGPARAGDDGPSARWTVDRPGDATSPQDVVGVSRPDGRHLAVSYPARVDLLAADGSRIWSTSGLPVAGVTLASGDVDGDGTDDVLVGQAEPNRPPVQITALDGGDGSIVWNATAGGDQINDLMIVETDVGRRLVSATMQGLGDGDVEAFNVSTGDRVWAHDVGIVPMSLAHHDGTVLVGTRDGRVDLVDPADGQALGSWDPPGTDEIRSIVPTGTDGAPVATVGDRVVAGLRMDGSVRWTYAPDDERFWAGHAADGDGDGSAELYLNGYDRHHVHAVDPTDGSARWKAGAVAERTSFPFVSPTPLAVADLDGDGASVVVAAGATTRLRAYDPGTGAVAWKAPQPGPVDSLAVVGPADGGGSLVGLSQSYWFVGAVDAGGDHAWVHDPSPVVTGTEEDWDGDGTDDAIVTTAGHAYVHDGETGGTLLEVATWPEVWRGVTTNVATSDLTGDGQPDLIVSSRNTTVQGRVLAYDGATGDRLWRVEAEHILGSFTDGLVLHDVTGDGTDDVLFAANRGYPSYAYAVDGATGEQLWRFHLQDDATALTLAEPGLGPPVLVVGRDHWSCACHTRPALVGLRATDGVQLWTRPLERDARSLAALDRADGGDRVVVMDLSSGRDRLPVNPLQDEREAFLLLDPLTGTILRTVAPTDLAGPGANLGPWFEVFDVDGDGTDDIVHDIRSGPRTTAGRLAVTDGADGSRIWWTDERPTTPVQMAPGPGTGADPGRGVVATWAGGGSTRVRLHEATDGGAAWTHTTTEPPTRYIGAGRDAGGDGLVLVGEGTLLHAFDAWSGSSGTASTPSGTLSLDHAAAGDGGSRGDPLDPGRWTWVGHLRETVRPGPAVGL